MRVASLSCPLWRLFCCLVFLHSRFWHYGIIAMRKMTFSLPEALASLGARLPTRPVSEAVATRLQDRDLALIRACEIANEDPDVAEIEREFDGIDDAGPFS